MGFPGVQETHLVWFPLILFSLPGKGFFIVKMKELPIKSLVDENVFIPCAIMNDIPKELDLQLLSVLWIMKPLNGSERDVYHYIHWSHNPTRPGAYILDSDLVTGNVALHLPRVQFTDEGEYTCTVFYTPNKVEGRSTLLVSAKPSIALSHNFKCQVGRFYPKEIRVQWVKQTRDRGKVVLDGGIYSDQLISNSDGTFNVTNQLEVQGASAGTVYSCIVSHRSLESDLLLNYTVSDIKSEGRSERESERRSHIAALVATSLAFLVIIVICFTIFTYFKKSENLELSITLKPKVGNIISPLRIFHGEPLTLICPINGFKPKPLSVTWLKVDPRGRETELLSWDRGTTNINDPNYSHELAEDEREEGEEEDDMNYFLSNLTLTPTVREDHGAQYVCRTHHYATEHTAEKRMELQVLAVPELDPIQTSSDILPFEEEMTLSCRIRSFHPKTLGVSWFKDDDILESTNDPILTDANGLFHVTSRTTYSPCVRDIGKTFKCEVSHPTLQNTKRVFWELKHLTCRPTISEIECDPEVPVLDQPVTLSCTVRDFYPETCTILWYEGRKSISPTNDTEPAQQDPESGLFSKTTQMTFTPTIDQQWTEYHVEITRFMTTIRTNNLKLKGPARPLPATL